MPSPQTCTIINVAPGTLHAVIHFEAQTWVLPVGSGEKHCLELESDQRVNHFYVVYGAGEDGIRLLRKAVNEAYNKLGDNIGWHAKWSKAKEELGRTSIQEVRIESNQESFLQSKSNSVFDKRIYAVAMVGCDICVFKLKNFKVYRYWKWKAGTGSPCELPDPEGAFKILDEDMDACVVIDIV